MLQAVNDVIITAGQLLPVDETLDEVKRRHTFVYRPQTRGKHEVELKCGDNQISKSPYEVRPSGM